VEQTKPKLILPILRAGRKNTFGAGLFGAGIFQNKAVAGVSITFFRHQKAILIRHSFGGKTHAGHCISGLVPNPS
jgi:hypothetical protein